MTNIIYMLYRYLVNAVDIRTKQLAKEKRSKSQRRQCSGNSL